jgi:tetratricopeptide (TPR) repeat protein
MNQSLSKYAPYLLFLFAIALYFNTINHGYVLDDFSLIKENFVVKSGFEGLKTIFTTHYRYGYGFQSGSLYRPIPLSIFAIQWELFPDQPWFAHLINVLLYALSGALLYKLLIKWMDPMVSLIATALFIAHPLHTEVVANIKSLDEILSLLLLVILLFYLHKWIENKNKKHLYLSILTFFIALLVKESAITFLGIIVLVLYFFEKQTIGDSLKKLLPFLIPLAPYFLMRFNALKSLTSGAPVTQIDNMLVGIDSTAELMATKIYLMGLYLYKIIYPSILMNDYSIRQIPVVSPTDWQFLISLIVILILAVIAFRSTKTKGLIGFGILFYIITLSISSNLILTIGTHFGERLVFLPILGFCIIAGHLIQQLQLQKNYKFIGLTGTILVLLLFSGKTISRNKAWESDIILYSTDIENCPNSARCNYSYALEVMKEKAVKANNPQEKQQYFAEAEKHFLKAIELNPSYSDAYGNLGLLKYRTKKYPEAEQYYLKAIELNPGNATVLSNLGAIYFEMKQYEAAKNTYSKALNANPNMADANANMGATLATLGQLQASIPYFTKAIELNPSNVQNYYFLGITYQNIGNATKAKEYLDQYNRMK